jgi:hypothetical protein
MESCPPCPPPADFAVTRKRGKRSPLDPSSRGKNRKTAECPDFNLRLISPPATPQQQQQQQRGSNSSLSFSSDRSPPSPPRLPPIGPAPANRRIRTRHPAGSETAPTPGSGPSTSSASSPASASTSSRRPRLRGSWVTVGEHDEHFQDAEFWTTADHPIFLQLKGKDDEPIVLTSAQKRQFCAILMVSAFCCKKYFRNFPIFGFPPEGPFLPFPRRRTKIDFL